MTRKALLLLLTSVLLLPASCACGYTANRMQGVRLGTEGGTASPLWTENMLWIGALGLMLVWARQVSKSYRTEASREGDGRMIRGIVLGAVLVLAFASARPASACWKQTPAGEAQERKREKSWLRKNSDKVVTGTWHLLEEGADEYSGYRMTGYIEALRGKRVERYRTSFVPEINCGFPNYYVNDGDKGRFYLEHDDPDPDDGEDGFIDAYDYVHFVPAGEGK
ncbi:hypothetical protein [Sphingopyxis sp. PET50]|uniref:hypothetical protein n=1 Tax=Sphingopyxis sp. PET50 TaxID=2976533 RepID=UPI0021AFE27D|nr:hypothetical protein [Sphingopyxis sp. PET50]